MRRKKPKAGVIVKGVDDILIKFGKCCQPVPGDAITVYITIGHGVTVHRTSCINALKMNPERQIDVNRHSPYDFATANHNRRFHSGTPILRGLSDVIFFQLHCRISL